MIEPTMKAIPARKNRLPTSRPAAARLSMKPVSEIAFGVSRDSISRSRTTSWVIPTIAARSRSALLWARSPRRRSAIRRHSLRDQAVAWPNAHASGRARASRCAASSAEMPAVTAPEKDVGHVVVPGRDHHERDEHRVDAPGDRAGRRLDRRAIGRPIISAKQTCIEGIAGVEVEQRGARRPSRRSRR